MMRVIVSEEQAERVGERITGGQRDSHFTVFCYRQPLTSLTLFGVEILSTRATILFDEPRAAVSVQP